MLIRLLVTMLSLMITTHIVPGITIRGFWPGLVAAVLLGLINLLIRPVFIIFTLPLTILTLGLFLFVINGIMLYLAAIFVDGFYVSNIFSATIAAIILSLINVFLMNIIG